MGWLSIRRFISTCVVLLAIAMSSCEAFKRRNGIRYASHISFSDASKEGHIPLEGHQNEYDHVHVKCERPKHMLYTGESLPPSERLTKIGLDARDISVLEDWVSSAQPGDVEEWHFRYVTGRLEAALVYIHGRINEDGRVHLVGLGGRASVDKSQLSPLIKVGNSLSTRRFTQEEHDAIVHRILAAIGESFEEYLLEHEDFDFSQDELDRHAEHHAKRTAMREYRKHKRRGKHEDAKRVYDAWNQWQSAREDGRSGKRAASRLSRASHLLTRVRGDGGGASAPIHRGAGEGGGPSTPTTHDGEDDPMQYNGEVDLGGNAFAGYSNDVDDGVEMDDSLPRVIDEREL